MKRLFILLLFLVSPVWATVPEIPGDGVDNGTSSGTAGACGAGLADAVYSVGCDLLKPEPDKDGDGYTSNGSLGDAGTTETDCDDTNRTIYPGVHIATGCTGSDHKTCQTSGSYTSCQTGPLCEATGSGVCKYIDCGSGSNSNAGTYASPYLTFGKVSGGSDGSPPASPYTLTPGDAVYLIGSGTCSTTFNADIGGSSTPVLFKGTVSGTSGDRIRLKRYPGSTALLSATNSAMLYLQDADYYTIEGFKGAGTGSSIAMVYGSFADHLIISRLNVTGLTGDGDYNHGCIKITTSNDSETHHNYLGECSRNTGNIENVAAIFHMHDENLAQGADHDSHHEVLYWAAYSNTANGSGFYGKHGSTLSDTGVNGHRFRYSYVVNPRAAIQWNGSGLRAKRIFGYSDGSGYETSTSVQAVLRVTDNAVGAPHEDNLLEESTFVNMSSVGWPLPAYLSATEKLTVRKVVVSDNAAAYVSGNGEGIVTIDPYGSNTQKGLIESQSGLAINNNCYYNAVTTLSFSYFNQASGGHGPAGNLGGDYSFANWKTASSQDANSFAENPSFDSMYRATASNCANKGWLLTTEEVAPTPTPGVGGFSPWMN